MKYIEAPTEYQRRLIGNEKSIFLAGGISNCYDWQSELSDLLKNNPLVILNPRRKNFPMNDPTAAKKQIEWEFVHMRKADAISFWFSKETLNPIVLYELGAHSMTDKKLFVGLDPEYLRKVDIETQTALIRPDIQIVYSLDALGKQITNWVKDN